jgi:hypothetical protein
MRRNTKIKRTKKNKTRKNSRKNTRKNIKRRRGGCGSVSCANAGSAYSTSGQWTSTGGSIAGQDVYKHTTDPIFYSPSNL